MGKKIQIAKISNNWVSISSFSILDVLFEIRMHIPNWNPKGNSNFVITNTKPNEKVSRSSSPEEASKLEGLMNEVPNLIS